MNKVKEKLKSGIHTIGAWMQIPSMDVAYILANSGFDWIALDLEHGSFSLDQLPNLFRIIESQGTIPLARVAQNHPKDIKQALDAGAKGIIVPMIESLDQVENLLRWSQYPSRGNRGIGYSAANLFGKNFTSYFEKFNSEIVLVIQIENINALEQIDMILSKDEIDAMMIGPYDLSGSMGLTGQFDHPDFLNAISRLKKSAGKNKMPLGTHVIEANTSKLQSAIEEGFKFIAYSTDGQMLMNGAKF